MYKCIIVDDEPIAIRVIKNHLSAFPDFELIAECVNALEAMTLLQHKNVDLMFCDIQMPQLTGVEFVRSLTNPPKVIFTTAYRDYAVDAFDLQVVDYLLKPVSFERFARGINNFLEHTLPQNEDINTEPANANKHDYLFLKADKKHHKINIPDIYYFESLGDYVIVFTEGKKIVTKERISHLAAVLSKKLFIQIHRSYIVSIQKIESVGPGFVEINKKKLPVGRNYKSQLNSLLQNN